MTTAASTTTAPPAMEVEIDVDGDDFFDPAPFTASGPAVEAGYVCATGTMTKEDYLPDPQKYRESWRSVFVCDDGNCGFVST